MIESNETEHLEHTDTNETGDAKYFLLNVGVPNRGVETYKIRATKTETYLYWLRLPIPVTRCVDEQI